jgi:O-antigen biosynthesis protein
VSRPTVSERICQTVRLLGKEGSASVARRIAERALESLPAADCYRQLSIDRDDLARVAEIAAGGWSPQERLPALPGEPLTVAWVCYAPGEGSGGHTTLFRMVSALERAGHRCIVYLRDDHGWSLDQHRRTIRRCWPMVQAEIRDLADGIEDAHAVFATSWQTAYPVLASPAKGARLYFVQDFEPAFYPAGSEAFLAEATLRFGFHAITAGSWLSDLLRRQYGMAAEHFDFGCDIDCYRLDRSADAASRRTGVCYYCRPSTPRRGHELAVMALDLFARRHPEIEIHLYGETAKSLPFEAVDHGVLSPAALVDLYNRCAAGLILSATNVSLVPYEMLACGCIPVVNDAEHNRLVLDNPEVLYVEPTPFELAQTLCALIERSVDERAIDADRAAASVQSRSWEAAGAVVEQAVRAVVFARAEADLIPA